MLDFIKNLTLESLLPAALMLVVGILVIRLILRLEKKSLAKSKLEKAARSLIHSLLKVVLYGLLGMMAADYVSGVAVAAMGRSAKTSYGGLSSKVGAMGLARKGLMLLVVLVAALLDAAMGAEAAMCRDAAIWFYIANEGLSLLENMSLAGVPFPDRLKRLLGHKQQAQEEEDDHGYIA